MSQIEESDARLGWTSEPDGRGTLNIIWSCILTMLLCSWSILCLNVPGPQETKRQVLRRKLSLTILSGICPELLLYFAFSQWSEARQSVQDFASLRHGIESRSEKQFNLGWFANLFTRKKWTRTSSAMENWTLSEAFFAEMGGFRLKTRDYLPFPIDAKQLHYLVSHRFIELPTLRHRNIEDKNKADGLLRAITLCQIIWFLINSTSRLVQRLTITTLELTTVSFILCSLMTAFFWWRKPADVILPEIIDADISILDILPTEDITLTEWDRSPLDFVNRREWWWSRCWSNWINVLRNMGLTFGSDVTPIDRIADTYPKEFSRKQIRVLAILSIAYGLVLFAAWHHSFPTRIEKTLWRVACCTMLGSGTPLLMASEAGGVWPRLRQSLSTHFSSRYFSSSVMGRMYPVEKMERVRKLASKLDRRLDFIRNNSPRKDPAFTASVKLILTMYIMAFLYCCARAYMLTADLIELRSLPASAYATVEWQKFFPNIS